MLKRFWMGILTILCSIGITIVISYAWFIKGLDVDPLATGSSTEAYYHSGTGTSTDPFIITTPRHLYNLAWLQYLGAYNKDKKSGTTFPATYFKVGLNSSITIDMTGWPLPPIGTVQYPFIGNFNGNGSTITNLTTTNKFSEFGDKHPSGVDDVSFEYDNCGAIGFFGSVGAYNNSIISGYDTLDGYTYDTANNKIYNFYLDDTNVHTSRSATLIGAVAGYVNAEISDVGVIKPHLNIETSATSKLTAKTSNLSDFAVVGYAEAAYTTQKTKTSTIIYNPTYDYSHFNFQGMGSQADWGGSMNMTDLYNRLVSINNVTQGRTSINSGSSYLGYELRYENVEKNKITANTTYTRVSNEDNGVVNIYHLNAGGSNGTYLKTQTSTSWSVAYQGLTALYKDVIIVTKTETIENGYTLNSNGQYLNISSSRVNNTITFNVSVSTDTSDSTVWVEESNGGGVNLYTYNEDDGYKYYLVGNSDLSLSLATTNPTVWHWDGSTYYTSINSVNYYLKYFHGEWTLKPTYAIGDGNGNYIKYENNTISNAESLSEASSFMFTDDDKIITNSGAYLRNNPVGTLSIATTNSYNTWANIAGQLFNQLNDVNYYIQYDNGWKLTTATSYYIQYNGNYLYINNSGTLQTAGTANINNATIFTFSDDLDIDGGEGTISAEINGNTYYLSYNGTTLGAVTLEDQYTTWFNDTGLCRNIGNTTYYLQFRSNSWQMNTPMQKNAYHITYNTYTLGTNGTSLSNSTSNWFFDENNYLYTIIEGTKYYIYRDTSNSRAYLTSDINHNNLAYMYSNNSIRDRNSTTYKLRYNNNRWNFSTNNNITVNISTVNIDDFDNTPLGIYTASNVSALSFTSRGNSVRGSSSINKYERQDGISEPSLFNYIPLNALNTTPYTVNNNNTGYIMSGGYHPDSHFDIRVSRYALSSIQSSYASNNWENNAILTVGNGGYGTAKYIGSNTYPESGFSKYTASKAQLLETLRKSTQYVYGLHFMEASIDKNHLVVAPEVMINGQTYYNYEMPENSIDFQLASNGYINFFAGTYFPNNDSFFSLHEVIRDSNNKISSIKHISKIYKANPTYGDGYKALDFIYQYTDGTWSGENVSSNSKYTLAFDKTWIEAPETVSGNGGDLYNSFGNYLWYFEIPVNKGEYALGSVDGGAGAYLIYLDIGANAAPVDRTEITQKTTTNQEVLSYANGIQILAAGSTFTSDSNSCVAKIENTQTGLISITRTGDTVTFNTPLNSTYKDESITFNGTITPVSQSQTTSIVLKYVDYNRATDKLYFTTIYNNGTTNTSYDCYRIDDLANGTKTEITDRTDQAEWGLLKIVSGSGTHTTDVTDSAFDIDMQSLGSTKILDYYSYINTTDISTYSLSSSMSVDVNTTLPPADGEYAYEHAYKLVGNDLVLTPNGLVVYIGPDFKTSATITGPTSNVVTVTTVVNNVTYTFTFNANAIDNTAKTVTIYYVAPETP